MSGNFDEYCLFLGIFERLVTSLWTLNPKFRTLKRLGYEERRGAMKSPESMIKSTVILVAASASSPIVAQNAEPYKQLSLRKCGGVQHHGPTTCDKGFNCIYADENRSLCLPIAPLDPRPIYVKATNAGASQTSKQDKVTNQQANSSSKPQK
ncbi:hypothetical protein CVT25_015434 [Psilocybe cyanescens]|uniref:CBM1 domain-containing protein n=1 Tax=Psilocybe cyanescens TaxID=93625 RepID=A0A409WHQ2_PSICY|nr:hypothetical protein CVT25_015434 [Psilocybe cyanescens]